jgi:hypothetical protein
MIEDEDKPITLSREDLYELAWSKPILELAKDFGISDVGLAKRCKRLDIPIPGRGYWARVDAGQTPYKPKLPKREVQWHDDNALTVAPSVGAYRGALAPTVEAEASSADHDGTEAVATRIAALTIVPSASILAALPPIKRTALRSKHPDRSELTFERGEKAGSLVEMQVTSDALERALLLADTLLRAAQALGWEFGECASKETEDSNTQGIRRRERNSAETPRPDPEPPIGRLIVKGEEVIFRIEERFRDEKRVPTAAELAREKREYGYHAPRKIAVATGALRVVRLDTYRTYGDPNRRTWYDRKGTRVEEQIKDILLGFYQLALSIKERRAKDEREAREHEEAERRREEWEAIQEANQKLITQLETDAGAWHRARYLRRYIQAARKRFGGQSLPAVFRTESVDFFDWAEGYLNQLDPLHGAERTGEFEEGSTHHFQNDLDRLKKAFGRLLGSEWSDAWKVGRNYTPAPKPERYGYYGDKSVFEIDSPDAPGDADD